MTMYVKEYLRSLPKIGDMIFCYDTDQSKNYKAFFVSKIEVVIDDEYFWKIDGAITRKEADKVEEFLNNPNKKYRKRDLKNLKCFKKHKIHLFGGKETDVFVFDTLMHKKHLLEIDNKKLKTFPEYGFAKEAGAKWILFTDV